MKKNLLAKEINFLPQRIVLAKQKRKNILIYCTMAVIIVALLGELVWLPIKMAQSYQEKINQMQAAITELDKAKPDYDTMVTLQKDLDNKRQGLKEIQGQQQKFSVLLKGITGILPKDCYVDRLVTTETGDFRLKVVVNDPVETANILGGLRKLKLFKKVDLADAKTTIEEKQTDNQLDPDVETTEKSDNVADKGRVPFTPPGQAAVTFNAQFTWAKEEKSTATGTEKSLQDKIEESVADKIK